MYKPKLIPTVILVISVFVASACGRTDKTAQKETVQQEASLIEVSIGGMTCTGCEQTIQNNIGNLEGVKSVKASFKTGNAIVEYYPALADTSKIKDVVTDSGYSFKKFNLP